MKWIQSIAGFLRDVIEWRRQQEMKDSTMPLIDTDTPDVMQRGNGSSENQARKITHIIRGSNGEPLCELCKGDIVEVNEHRGTQACFKCGARVEGT